jgi:hypothetical protein
MYYYDALRFAAKGGEQGKVYSIYATRFILPGKGGDETGCNGTASVSFLTEKNHQGTATLQIKGSRKEKHFEKTK